MVEANQTRTLSLLAHSMAQLLEPLAALDVPLSWQDDPEKMYIPSHIPVGIHQAVLERMCRSLRAEVEISEVLQERKPQGARFARPQHRVKSPMSIADKVSHRLQRKNLEPTLENSRTIINAIDDIVRYSYVAPTDDAFLPLIQASTQSLLETGHICLKAKSAFIPGGSYRGIITGWATSRGEAFEVQYHTEASVTPNDEAHALYRVIRDPERTDADRQAAIDACIRIFSTVPTPPGVTTMVELAGIQVKPYEGLRIGEAPGDSATRAL